MSTAGVAEEDETDFGSDEKVRSEEENLDGYVVEKTKNESNVSFTLGLADVSNALTADNVRTESRKTEIARFTSKDTCGTATVNCANAASMEKLVCRRV